MFTVLWFCGGLFGGGEGFGVEFVDDFVKNAFAELVAVDVDEEVESFVILEDGCGFGAEFLEAGLENLEVFVVKAVAAVVENFGLVEAAGDVGFGDVEDDGGFDFVAGAGGDGNDLVFLAVPAADGGEDEGVFAEVFAFKVRQNPFVEDVGGDEGAFFGEVLAGLLLHGADNHAGGEEFGAEGFGELDALSVFAGHGEAENVDRAGAEPVFDGFEFVCFVSVAVHNTMIAYYGDGENVLALLTWEC